MLLRLVSICCRIPSCSVRVTQSSLRLFLEASLASVPAIILVVTWLCPSWIELIFHLAPDPGRGELEYIIVTLVFVVTVLCLRLSRRVMPRSIANR